MSSVCSPGTIRKKSSKTGAYDCVDVVKYLESKRNEYKQKWEKENNQKKYEKYEQYSKMYDYAFMSKNLLKYKSFDEIRDLDILEEVSRIYPDLFKTEDEEERKQIFRNLKQQVEDSICKNTEIHNDNSIDKAVHEITCPSKSGGKRKSSRRIFRKFPRSTKKRKSRFAIK
jgi:hypothetical protein